MARYTASEKWGDGWFSDLQPVEKLIFLYLTDKCDNAGFYEINKRLDPIIIGISLDEYLAGLAIIKTRYISSSDGRKIWLKNYLKHQKNLPLNPENNAHKQIIQIITSNLIFFEYDFNYLGANKGLFSPPVMVMYSNCNSNDVLNKEKKEEKKTFNTKPTHTDFIDLPEIQINQAIQLVKISKQTDISEQIAREMWAIFKIQNLTGEEYYANEGKVYSHFINWIKKQDFANGTSTNKQFVKSGSKQAGLEALLERGKQKFAAAGGKGGSA